MNVKLFYQSNNKTLTSNVEINKINILPKKKHFVKI